MEILEQLLAMGYKVQPFSLRIADVLDVWLPSGKWRDLRTGERGRKPLDQLPHFVKQRLEIDYEKTLSHVPLRRIARR